MRRPFGHPASPSSTARNCARWRSSGEWSGRCRRRRAQESCGTRLAHGQARRGTDALRCAQGQVAPWLDLVEARHATRECSTRAPAAATPAPANEPTSAVAARSISTRRHATPTVSQRSSRSAPLSFATRTSRSAPVSATPHDPTAPADADADAASRSATAAHFPW